MIIYSTTLSRVRVNPLPGAKVGKLTSLAQDIWDRLHFRFIKSIGGRCHALCIRVGFMVLADAGIRSIIQNGKIRLQRGHMTRITKCHWVQFASKSSLANNDND